jgi:pimeloyl-ACP methyl ester carboxylesterase
VNSGTRAEDPKHSIPDPRRKLVKLAANLGIMPHLGRAVVVAAAFAAAGATACWHVDGPYATDEPMIEWERCPGLNFRMRCGMLTVPETHGASGSEARTIRVAFAISPARRHREADEPVLVLLGGPGGSATGQLRGTMSDYKALNRHRDVVLVDQRGIGRSSPLHCTFGPAAPDSSAPGRFLPPAHVRACVEHLRASADLSRYTTSEFVADLELLREALGISRWNLHGTSYGSRAAILYMQRHPQRVRGAILVGVVPPELRMPMTLGPDADSALEKVVADCAADEQCARAYPSFRAEVDSIAHRLDAAPALVQVEDPRTRKATTVPYTREMFGMAVRGAMYVGSGASNLPSMIHQAYHGDFAPLMERGIRNSRRMTNSGVAGLYLAVTCAEDVARADRDSAIVLNEASTMGAARARSFFAACAEWPAHPHAIEWPDSTPLTPPVLMMVGDADPATPPYWAELVMRNAVDGRLVVVPQGGHVLSGLYGMGCLDRLQSDFLTRPEPASLDVTCLQEVRRPPFAVPR